MEYYNAKLRLHGSVSNEVLKEDLSAPEIIILRKVHGEDAVVDINLSKEEDIDEAEERRRLADRYDSGLRKIEEPTSVAKLFGEGFTPLLSVLPEFKNAKKPVVQDKKKGVI